MIRVKPRPRVRPMPLVEDATGGEHKAGVEAADLVVVEGAVLAEQFVIEHQNAQRSRKTDDALLIILLTFAKSLELAYPSCESCEQAIRQGLVILRARIQQREKRRIVLCLHRFFQRREYRRIFAGAIAVIGAEKPGLLPALRIECLIAD